MKRIPLTQGMVALVDDADYEFLNQWRWYAHHARRTFYAARTRRPSDGPGPSTIYMHRVILGPPDGMDTDHVDGNGLDNRRQNLQSATRAMNSANRPRRNNNRKHDIPLGVWKVGRRFRASIGIDGHNTHLGTFDTPKEAHAAYMTARVQRLSERAQLA
jgi:hypothetical protein